MDIFYFDQDGSPRSAPESRVAYLNLATAGALQCSDQENTPVRKMVGSRDADKQLKLSAFQRDYYDTFNVEYIGRTYAQPNYVFVLSKGSTAVGVRDIVDHLPEDWWHTVGYIRSTNVERIREFLETTYAVPLVLDDATEARVKYLGIPYARVPIPDETNGNEIRELASRVEWRY